MPQYFLDYYMPFCPEGCDKKECPKDEQGETQSPRGCPKQEKSLYARCDLGILSKDELELLTRNNEDPDIMIFRKAKTIPLNTLEEQDEHLRLIKLFAENSSYLPFYIHYQIKRARRLQSLAKEWREIREEALATVVSWEDEESTPPKEPTADEKLRAHLKNNRDDIVKKSTELADIIGEKDDNIRKTKTWALVRAVIGATQKTGKIGKLLNNDQLSIALREKLEDDLQEVNQALALVKLELFHYLDKDTVDVKSET